MSSWYDVMASLSCQGMETHLLGGMWIPVRACLQSIPLVPAIENESCFLIIIILKEQAKCPRTFLSSM